MAPRFPASGLARPSFGRRIRENVAPAHKDAPSPEREIAFRRIRLRAHGVELSLFYEAAFDELTPQFLVRRDDDGPFLSIGEPIGILLEADREATSDEAGLRRIVGPVSLAVGDTPARDRAARRDEILALRTTDIAVDLLVGHSLEAVERRLVLRTLRSFKGDYLQTAFALGVSIDELSKKLAAILYPALCAPPGHEGEPDRRAKESDHANGVNANE